MRILLITQLFYPEPNHLKGLAFAKELTRLGHEVEVLTGFPNYPGGKIYQGYRQKIFQKENIEGISVVRVPLIPDHSESSLRRIVCYLSLAFSTCIPGLFLIRRPDVVHVYQGPATLALPAVFLRFLRRIPFVLDVQDLWPESVTSSGMLSLPGGTFLLNKWCNLIHRLANKIVVLSPGYKEVLSTRSVPESKVEIVYNWCPENQINMASTKNVEDDPFGFGGKFTIIYAGNLWRVQALDAVLYAASHLRDEHPDILFVFVGDGIDALRLKEIAASKKLNNVRFIPRQPVSEINILLYKADALLIHLRDDPLCRVGIPQKTQAYLAAGKPVIVGVKGDAADLVSRAEAGVACEPGQPLSIVKAVKKIYELPPCEREQMGRNGMAYYEKHLSFAVGVRRMDDLFRGAAK